VYLDEYKPASTAGKSVEKAPSSDEMQVIEATVTQVFANPSEYRGARAPFSYAKIRAVFHLTLRQAHFVVELCKQRSPKHG
jgi:hypothetical protein